MFSFLPVRKEKNHPCSNNQFFLQMFSNFVLCEILSMGRSTALTEHDSYCSVTSKKHVMFLYVSTVSMFLYMSTDLEYLSGMSCLNSFPNKPLILRVISTGLLKTLWEKEKLLITSNFSFSQCFFAFLKNFCNIYQI